MPKILIVEDDKKLRENLCILIENEGYEYDCAENGKIGLEKVFTNIPDLIISDIMMPDVNGYELLEELQKYPETESIPFIFLTAVTGQDSFREGMRAGADDYIFKPFKVQELLEAIEIRLEKKNRTEKRIIDLQEQIAAKVPHELRTPLVPIIGYAELIDDEEDINTIKEMAKVIKNDGKKLHRRIEKYLLYKDLIALDRKSICSLQKENYTNIEANNIKYYLTSLSEELNAYERMDIMVEECLLPMKEEFLEVAIRELVENGLKYSEEKEKVSLKGYRENGNYRIIIIDNGRGMKKNEINTLSAFNKFGKNQLSEEGSGLGLAIVKKILEYYKCSLIIESEIMKFTRVEVIIPINKENGNV